MGYTPEMERDFIKKDLGPTLAKFGYSDVKVMMLDDVRGMVESWVDTILDDHEAAKYVSGIAVHWYNEKATPPSVLTQAHTKYVFNLVVFKVPFYNTQRHS